MSYWNKPARKQSYLDNAINRLLENHRLWRNRPGITRIKVLRPGGRDGHFVRFIVKSRGRTGAALRQELIARGLTNFRR